MANSFTEFAGGINLTYDGSTNANWVWSDNFGGTEGLRVHSIQLVPATADDKVVIREASITGAKVVVLMNDANLDSRTEYLDGQLMKPAIEYDDCTFTAGTMVIIRIVR